MKLIRYGKIGNEKPGIITDEGQRIDATGCTADYNQKFFENNGLKRLAAWADDAAADAPVLDEDTRLGVPVANPSKIVCIGLNYIDHAKEGGMDIPEEPIIFFKATSSLCGPFDDVIIPKNSSKTDWEVELAVIIGKKASYVSKDEAKKHVAGYTIHNDVSERAFQLERGGQWVKGKSCDTFAPVGPYLATPDEMDDINQLNLWLDVNGERKQDGTTAEFIFDIPHLISYISQFMTLLPGDIISTGTPAGVGLGFTPPQYLKDGDIVELGIDGLGSSKQTFTSYQP